MHRFFKGRGRDLLIILIIMTAFYVQHLLSFRFGINFEEGRDANAYHLVMQGYRPYQDFEWGYGPFSLLIYPRLMRTFGVNLAVLRVSFIIFASLVVPLAYFLARKIMPPVWAGLAAFLGIVFFDVPHYTYNHIFAVLGELACLLMITTALQTGRYKINLVFAGLFAAVTMLTKPAPSGVTLFLSVFLFMGFLKLQKQMPLRFTPALFFFFGASLLASALFVHFYPGEGALRHYFLKSIPVFSPDPAGSVYQVGDHLFLKGIRGGMSRLSALFDVNKAMNAASSGELKDFLVSWFDNFMFWLYYFVPLALGLLYLVLRKTDTAVREIFRENKNIILLFVIFSLVVSVENWLIKHDGNRPFNIQGTFILTAGLFYLLTKAVTRRKALVLCFIVFFTFYLSFLHFFRYPWSNSRKYTHSLNLPRAGAVKVTPAQKDIYESLAVYLADSLGPGEGMVVLGYNPHISFLTGQKNIFEKEEALFLKLEHLTRYAVADEMLLPALVRLEDKIIDTMNTEKPKFVVDTVFDGALYNNRVGDYIRRKYRRKKTFGPAEIYGIKNEKSGTGRVDLYRR